LRILSPILIKEIGLKLTLLLLVSEQLWLHRMSSVAFLPFLFYALKHWCFTVKVCLNSAMNLYTPRIFFVGRLFITASISLLILDLFKWFIAS
jgi:hypothetical protein